MVHPFKACMEKMEEHTVLIYLFFLNPISHSVRRAYNFHLVFLLHNSIDINPIGLKNERLFFVMIMLGNKNSWQNLTNNDFFQF